MSCPGNCNKLKFTITPIEQTLTFDMREPQTVGVTDIQIDGTSILDDGVANINLGQGLTFDNELKLSITDVEEVNPLQLSIPQQQTITLYVEQDGVLKKINLNNLDYSKIKVQDVEDLSKVNVNDIIFVNQGGQ